jgi:hypothetical protein
VEIIAGFPIAISPEPAAVVAMRQAANHADDSSESAGNKLVRACPHDPVDGGPHERQPQKTTPSRDNTRRLWGMIL